MPFTGLFTLPVLCLWMGSALAADNFYSHSMTSISGEDVDLSQYTGKVSLVVNVASECGYTDNHYRALVRLQDQLKLTEKFNVLAFPSNQFGAQEPKRDAEIYKFAADTYKVNFPMFSKINVIDNEVPPAWRYLVGATGQAPTWNFWKYLVDHEGNVVEAWGPWTEVHAIVHHIHEAVDKAVAADSEQQPRAGREDL